MSDLSVTCLRFNANYSTLFASTRDKFKLIDLRNEHFSEEFEEPKGLYLIDRYLQSRLLFLVKFEERKKLYLFNIQTRQKFTNLRFESSIVAVRSTYKRLVVCLENKIEIYDIPKIENIHVLEDVPANPQGIIALCLNEERSYLAYPGSAIEGIVNIFDVNAMKTVTRIAAHKGLLSAVSFNATGTLFATASEKGTVIRVFATDEIGTRLVELRRGLARSASIHSLTFSEDNSFLVACSNTETVHVFRLGVSDDSTSCNNNDENITAVSHINELVKTEEESEMLPSSPSDNQEGWLQWMYSTLCASTYYLPTQVTDILRPSRAVIVARLTSASANLFKIAAIIKHNNLPRLVVASSDGSIDLFAVDPINGGEAHHITTTNVFESELNSSGERSDELDIDDVIHVERNTTPSFLPVERSPSTLEGMANLRLHDPTEFPCLSNAHKYRKKR